MSVGSLFSVTTCHVHFEFVGKESMHTIWNEFEFTPDPTTDLELSALECQKIPHRLIMSKQCLHFFLDVYGVILADSEDMHKSLDGFDFRPDPITDYGVSCPKASKNPTSPLLNF